MCQRSSARPFLLSSCSFTRTCGRGRRLFWLRASHLLPGPFSLAPAPSLAIGGGFCLGPFSWGWRLPFSGTIFCGNVLQVAAFRLGAGWWLVGFGAWVCRVGWVVSGRVPVGLCFFWGLGCFFWFHPFFLVCVRLLCLCLSLARARSLARSLSLSLSVK